MNSTTETNTDTKRTVDLTLNGETREVEIERLSVNHCWHATMPIVCRFPTGNKEHLVMRPQVVERNGKFVFCIQSYRNRNVARPTRWYEGQDVSKW